MPFLPSNCLDDNMDNLSSAVRMCPVCLTTDASFPNIPGCQSCQEMLAHDELVFWNTPLYVEEQTPVMPHEVMRRIFQPWRTLLGIITLS